MTLPLALYLQAQPEGMPGGQILVMVVIMVVFYLMVLRPQQKRQKKIAEVQGNLKNGDRVLTASGLHGTIVGLRDEFVVLRVPPDSVKLEIERSSVLTVETGDQEKS
jgi:preprotein translocase subunit YajC